MARQIPKAEAVSKRPVLDRKGIESAIVRLQRRISEVEDLEPHSLEKYSPDVAGLQASIDETLSRIFGHGSIEYQRYHKTINWAENIPSFGSEITLDQYRQDIIKGKQEVFVMLRQAVHTLTEELEELEGNTNQPPAQSKLNNRKVFIVHGHDDAVRESVARFLSAAGCEPIILNEQASRNRTVIEKIEANDDVRFAVVLLTPDDEGAKKGDALQPRARQNVLLELSYFIAKLGRGNVCALRRGDVEIPSDFAGVIWTAYDSAAGWKRELAKELEAAGILIDWKKAMT